LRPALGFAKALGVGVDGRLRLALLEPLLQRLGVLRDLRREPVALAPRGRGGVVERVPFARSVGRVGLSAGRR
jgi:hypothetical protein